MSSGRVSTLAYKAGIFGPWQVHMPLKSVVTGHVIISGLILRRMRYCFVSVYRAPRGVLPVVLGVRKRPPTQYWRPAFFFLNTSFFSSTCFIHEERYILPFRMRSFRPLYSLVAEAQRLRLPSTGRRRTKSFHVRWFTWRQEFVRDRVMPIQDFCFDLDLCRRVVGAASEASDFLCLPVSASIVPVEPVLMLTPLLLSTVFSIGLQASRRYSISSRLFFSVLCLGCSVFWRDMALLSRVVGVALQQTHFHYSALKHIGRMLSGYLFWSVHLRVIVMQLSGRFNQRERTGRFDMHVGSGPLRRSSFVTRTYYNLRHVRTYRGAFGVRVWGA